MVNRILALVCFLIFTVEVTPYMSILMLGVSKTVIFATLIAVGVIALVSVRRIHLSVVLIILLALALNELIYGALNNQPSINFVRITAAVIGTMILLSRADIYGRTLDYLRISHIAIVGGFLVAIFLVFLLGSGVLQPVFQYADSSVFRKIDFTGASRVRSLLIYNFTLAAEPALNVLNLNVLPSGTAAEPHPFFSFILISAMLLYRSGRIGWRMIAASAAALVMTYSVSNGLGLLGAITVTLLIYLANNLRARRLALNILAVSAASGLIYLWRSGMLQQEKVTLTLMSFDRSVAESYATIVRFLTIGNGRYPLEAVPHYFNDFTFFPLSLSSFVLFVAALLAIFWKLYGVAKRIAFVDIFLLSYIFAYSFKSFGVTLFQPFMLMALLVVLFRIERVSEQKISREPVRVNSRLAIAKRQAAH